MQSNNLILDLIEQTRQIMNQVEKLKSHDLTYLTWRDNENAWNILECLEHLNLYGDFYLPQIETKIKSSSTEPDPIFKSGLLGNYFSKSMLPKENLNKMKTFKDKDPLKANLDKNTIDRMLSQHNKLLELLSLSRNKSLNKIRIETSITSFIKLKLGDTFQFFINHILRHMAQIDRIHANQSHS